MIQIFLQDQDTQRRFLRETEWELGTESICPKQITQLRDGESTAQSAELHQLLHEFAF